MSIGDQKKASVHERQSSRYGMYGNLITLPYGNVW